MRGYALEFLPRKWHCFRLLIIFSVILITMSCQKRSETFIITAHRGASHVAPENTLAAVKKAVELGADCVEIDVWQAKDGEIVLMHDETLKRTTNETGEREIWTYTLEELKKLDAGFWFGEEFRGEQIPTLHEVIQFAKGRVKLNIEIKVSREEPEIAQKVIDIIRAEGFDKECMVTSFDRNTIETVKHIASDIKTGFIFNEDYSGNVFQGNWDVLSCNYKVVNKEFVASARKNGKEIHVWTVNNRLLMERLIGLKVDGIITNRPDIFVPLVR